MQLPEVEVIGLQQTKALLEQAQRAVPCAVVRLGGQEHLVTPGRHDLADVGLRDPTAVGGGRIDVVHAEVERSIDDGDRFVVSAGSLQRRLTAETEQSHVVPGAAERPLGHRRLTATPCT